MRALASAALGVAGVALLSYANGLEPLRRWMDPPMAINTASCIVVLSLAVLLLTVRGK